MAGDLGELLVRISADISKLNKELDRADKEVSGFSERAQKAANLVGIAFAAMAATAAFALTKVVKSSIEFGNELDRMSKLTGVSAAEFAKLQFAVEQEHGSIEALSKAFPILAQRMSDAKDGMENYAREFRRLGVEFKNSDGTLRKVNEVFIDMAEAIKNTDNKTQALASTSSLLGGRVGKDLLPVLDLGKKGLEDLFQQFERFGVADDKINQFAESSEAFGDTMNTIKTRFTLLALEVTDAVLPKLQEFATWLSTTDLTPLANALINITTLLVTLAEKAIAAANAIARIFSGSANPNEQGGTLTSPLVSGGSSEGGGGDQGGGGTQPGGGESGAGAGGGGGGGGLSGQFDALIAKLNAFGALQKTISAQFQQLWTKAAGQVINSFGTLFASVMMGTETVGEAFKKFAQGLLTTFLTAIGKMIAITLAWIAIAIIAMIFGAEPPDFKTFFKSALALSGGFREGGAIFARQGAMFPSSGVASAQAGLMTGPFGEGGIPAFIHPNEIVTPIDKFFEVIKAASAGGNTFNIISRSDDPRQIAELVALEVERISRNP